MKSKIKPMIRIEYKYPNEPWVEYDSTNVPEWGIVQYDRMLREHPNAEDHRKVRR